MTVFQLLSLLTALWLSATVWIPMVARIFHGQKGSIGPFLLFFTFSSYLLVLVSFFGLRGWF